MIKDHIATSFHLEPDLDYDPFNRKGGLAGCAIVGDQTNTIIQELNEGL